MKLIGFKPTDLVVSSVLTGLEKLGVETSRGSIARLFGQVIGEEVGTLYSTLQLNHLMAFLSTAEKEALDAIGFLLNCKRNDDEDAIYKDRISKQTQNLATSNKIAIELAGLSVAGVQDILMNPFTKGTGSFSVFIITSPGYDQNTVLEAVKFAISETVAYGILFEVETPDLIEIELTVKLMFNTIASEADKITAFTNAQKSLKKYIASRAIGEALIINEITEQVMSSHNNVLNYALISIKANGREMLKVDQIPRWNQRFIESSKPEAIKVS